MAERHVHDWIEISIHPDKGEHFLCAKCGAERIGSEVREAAATPSPIELAARAVAVEMGVDPDRIITADDDAHVGFNMRKPHPAWTRYIGVVGAALSAARQSSEGALRVSPDYQVSLRQATEDDVIAALQGAYVTLPLSEPAELLEFFNRMLDVLGVEADD